MPNPIDDSDLYDVLVVTGVASPGVVRLSGHDRVIGWDVKKGAGQSGATTTRTSEDPIEFTATFSLVDADDWAAWRDFSDLLRSSVKAKKPQALDVYHPDLAENDIKSVVLKSMGGTVHDGKGGATIAVKLLEYRPPKPAGGSPAGSKSKAKKDPNADVKEELAKTLGEYQKTPWG